MQVYLDSADPQFGRPRSGPGDSSSVAKSPETQHDLALEDSAIGTLGNFMIQPENNQLLCCAVSQIALVGPEPGLVANGLKNYETNANQCNSARGVARGHRRWPEALRS